MAPHRQPPTYIFCPDIQSSRPLGASRYRCPHPRREPGRTPQERHELLNQVLDRPVATGGGEGADLQFDHGSASTASVLRQSASSPTPTRTTVGWSAAK